MDENEDVGVYNKISLHGGQVISWRNDQGEELLFTSNKAIFKRIMEKFKMACESERFRKETTFRRRDFRGAEEDMSKEGFTVRIIPLYGKVGLVVNAQKVFIEMPEKNCKRSVLSFNALLSVYGVSKRFDVVEQLFSDLPDMLSIKPDIVSYNTLIKALCEKGSLSEDVALFGEIENKGLKPI